MKTFVVSLIAVVGFTCSVLAHDLSDLEKDLEQLTARVVALEQQLFGESVTPTEAQDDGRSSKLSELAQAGEAKFNAICTACHKNSFSDPMLAPPMAMVKDHYSRFFKEDKDGFVNAVVEWVKNPTQEKTRMPGAIRNFKIMPPLPLPDEDLRAIATYLFEADIPQPTNFEEHIRQERKQLKKGTH